MLLMYTEKELNLGGIKQVVALEGTDSGAIMIMFHGGPWAPVIYGHGYRGFYPELYNNLGLVWWDQYGTGRNHVKHIDPNITVQTFADMAVDLVDQIHSLFPERPLILNGNSFGSYLAMYAAHKRADIVSGVICLGPICNMTTAAANFENAAKAHYTAKERAQVEQLRARNDIHFFLLVADKLAEKYTNCGHYKGREAHDMTVKLVWQLLRSKDWTLADFAATLKQVSTAGKAYDALWNSLLEIDITEIYNTLELPILLLQGSEELYVLPTELQALAQRRQNIEYIKFDHCGHIPTTESLPKMIHEMLCYAKQIEGERHEH